MAPVLRDACDNCHQRKTRCVRGKGAGACRTCKANLETCTFSPRSTMGRPRVSRRRQAEHSGPLRYLDSTNVTLDQDLWDRAVEGSQTMTAYAGFDSVGTTTSEHGLGVEPLSQAGVLSPCLTPSDAVLHRSWASSPIQAETATTAQLLTLYDLPFADLEPDMSDSQTFDQQRRGIPTSNPASDWISAAPSSPQTWLFASAQKLIETNHELSELLLVLHDWHIDLHSQFGSSVLSNETETETPVIRESAFPSVSSLCDITTSLNPYEWTCSGPKATSCQQLALLGTKYVTKIYSFYLHSLRLLLGSEQGRHRPSGTHEYVEALTRAQIMEIHLLKLERFVTSLPASVSHNTQTFQQVTQVRSSLTEMVEKCRRGAETY